MPRLMTTVHVLYDPTDRIEIGPPDKLPPGVEFVSIKRDCPTNAGEARALAYQLAECLFLQMAAQPSPHRQ